MNWFKKLTTAGYKEVVSEKTTIFPKRTVSGTMKEIQNSFYNESDILLANAESEIKKDHEFSEVAERGKKLSQLGFNNVPEIDVLIKENKLHRKLSNNNSNLTKFIKIIKYFNSKYPNYKFITKESLNRICNEYNIIYQEIGKYEGNVSEKLLNFLFDSKIERRDCSYLVQQYKYKGEEKLSRWDWEYVLNKISEYSYEEPRYLIYVNEFYEKVDDTDHKLFLTKKPLLICAPRKYFGLPEMTFAGLRIVDEDIDDPIVICPVMYEGVEYYLVATPWAVN